MKLKKIIALIAAAALCFSFSTIPAIAVEGEPAAVSEPAVITEPAPENPPVTDNTGTETPAEPASPPSDDTWSEQTEEPTQPEAPTDPTPAPTAAPEVTPAPVVTPRPEEDGDLQTGVDIPDSLIGLQLSPTFNINIIKCKESNNCKYYVTDTASFVLVVGNHVATDDCRIVFRSSVVNSGYTDTEDYVAETYFANNLCDRYGGIFLWYTTVYNPGQYPNPSEYEYEEYALALSETIATLQRVYGINSYKFETSGYSGGDMAAIHVGAQLGADTILITDLHAQGNDPEWPITSEEFTNMVNAGTVVVDVRTDGVMQTAEFNRLEEQMYINGVDLVMIYVHGTISHGAVHRWIYEYTNIPLVSYGLENIMMVSDNSPYTYYSEMYKPLDSPST